MLGVAGALFVEIIGQGDWYTAPQWVSGMKDIAWDGNALSCVFFSIGVFHIHIRKTSK